MTPNKRELHELPYTEIVNSWTIRLASGVGCGVWGMVANVFTHTPGWLVRTV